MGHRVRAAVGAAVLLMTAAPAARAQAPAPHVPVRLLDVPFIQQSEALCGGAAAAMVMRYWGATGIDAATFAPLLDSAAGGIRGADLMKALGDRGWKALSFRGDPLLVRARLADGQPVIALIEDRPGVLHYVVVVAWMNGRVVLHDPARAPFRVLTEEAFERAWEETERWSLLALPGADIASVPKPVGASSSGSSGPESGCSALVSQAIETAGRGDHDSSLRMLRAAADICPRDSAPWREMAGVYAVQENWPSAVSHARQAVRRDGRDEHAWRILATAAFVTGDEAAALGAWNRAGEPVIDVVTVGGLEHTRHAAATALMRLAPKSLLTPRALSAANRRLDDLPAGQLSRVTFRPLGNGRVAVEAVLFERPRFPTSPIALAAIAAGAISERELGASVANPTGGGDLFRASWRWWDNRPRIMVSYSAPAPVGVLHVHAVREEQSYFFAPPTLAIAREIRTGGGLAWSDWTTNALRWQIGIAFDGWRGRGKTVSVTGRLEQRLARDHVSLLAGATALAGSFGASTWDAGIEWRSSLRPIGHAVVSRGGVAVTSARAPLALWPGAGVGHAREVLLRAHPLLDEGVMAGEVFGRRLYHAGLEWRRWFRPGLRIVPIGPAVFVDAARAAQRLGPDEVWQTDVGLGLRVAVAGNGVLRLDLARGLRDGKTTVSMGWMK